MVRALVFDFDGLLVDTETVALRAWEQTLATAGVPMPYEVWHAAIGGQGSGAAMLSHLSGSLGAAAAAELHACWWTRHLAMVDAEPVRPGVEEYLTGARRMGLALAVASSATGDWVLRHLDRLRLTAVFGAVITGDEHPPKPAPDTYRAAVAALGMPAAEAIAFEDSPAGVLAARAAGLPVVAVPNGVTSALTFPGADLVLPSFEVLTLPELLDLFDGRVDTGAASPLG